MSYTELNFFWCFLPANRAVEVNEMWRLRQKELELDKWVKEKSIDRSHRDDKSSRGTGRHADIDNSTRTSSASCSSKREYELERWVKDTSKDNSSSERSHRDGNSSRSPGRHAVVDKSTIAYTSSSSERAHEHGLEGLKDDELEEFLHSRYYISCFLLFYEHAYLHVISISLY